MTTRLHFPSRIHDNEEAYFSLLEGVVAAHDHLAQLSITYAIKGCHFRLVPSDPFLLDTIISELISLNNRLNIYMDMSKSCKTSSVFSFSISLT